MTPNGTHRKSILSFGRRGKQPENNDNESAETVIPQQQQQQQPVISLADLAAPYKGPQTFVSVPNEQTSRMSTAEPTFRAGNAASTFPVSGNSITSKTSYTETITEEKPQQQKRKVLRRVFTRRKKSEVSSTAAASETSFDNNTGNAPILTLADLARPYTGPQSLVSQQHSSSSTTAGAVADERLRSPLSIDAPVMIDYQSIGTNAANANYTVPDGAAHDDHSSDGGRSVNTVVSTTRSLVRKLSTMRLRAPTASANIDTTTHQQPQQQQQQHSLTPQRPYSPVPSSSSYSIGNMGSSSATAEAGLDTSPRKRSVLRSLLPKYATHKNESASTEVAATPQSSLPSSNAAVISLADLAKPFHEQTGTAAAAPSVAADSNNSSIALNPTLLPVSSYNDTATAAATMEEPAAADEHGKKWSDIIKAPLALKRTKSHATVDGAVAGSSSNMQLTAAATAEGEVDDAQKRDKWALFHRSQHRWFHSDKPADVQNTATGTNGSYNNSSNSSNMINDSIGTQPIITLADLAAPFKGPQSFVSTTPDTTTAASGNQKMVSFESPVISPMNSSNNTFHLSTAAVGAPSTSPANSFTPIGSSSHPLSAIEETATVGATNAAGKPAAAAETSPSSAHRKSIFLRAFGGRTSPTKQPNATDAAEGLTTNSAATNNNLLDSSGTSTAGAEFNGFADPIQVPFAGSEMSNNSSGGGSSGVLAALNMANPLYRRKMRLEEERIEEERLRMEDAARYSNMRETVTTLASQLDKLRTNLTVKMEEKDSRIQEVTERYSNLQSESQAMQSQFQQIQQQYMYMQQQYVMLQQNAQQTTQALSGEKQTAQQQLQQLQSDVAAAKSAREELEQRIRSSQVQLEEEKKKRMAAEAAGKEKEVIIEQLQSTGRQLEVEYQQLTRQKNELSRQYTAEQQKSSESSDKAYSLQMELKQVQASNATAQLQCSSLQQQYVQLQQQAMQRVQYMEQQYLQLQQQSTKQRDESAIKVQASEQAMQQLKQQVQQTQATSSKYESQIAALTSQLQELDTLRITQSADKAQLRELTSEKETLQQELAKVSDTLSKKDLECLRLSTQLTAKASEASVNSKELARLRSDIETVYKVETRSADGAKIQAEAKLAESQKQLLLLQQKLKEQWDYAQQQYAELQRKVQQLEKEKAEQQQQQQASKES